MKRPLISSHRAAVAVATALTAAAGLAWWDAFERRGKSRPVWLRFVPGVV